MLLIDAGDGYAGRQVRAKLACAELLKTYSMAE